jgi:hypothetical protein
MKCLWFEQSTNTHTLVGIELETMESCDAFRVGHPTNWLAHKSRAVRPERDLSRLGERAFRF